jgi:hypothetical protein
MTALKVAVSFASVFASYGQNELSVPEIDSVILLQGAIQEKSFQSPDDDQVETAGGYNLQDSLACDHKIEAAAPKMPPMVIQPSSPTSSFVESMKSVRLTPKADSDDPPGSDVLRVFLVIMIVAIMCDGTRRWFQMKDVCPQKIVGSNLDPATQKRQEEEAASEALWIEMVNAVTADDVPAFQKALARGASTTRTDDWSCTPLHFAAAGGSTAISNELLNRGAEVDALDASEETPLHFAARAGHSSICESLLDAKAKIDAVNVQGLTPLIVAGHANQEVVCRLLADRGAGAGGLPDEQLPPLVVCQLIRKVFDTA